MRTLKLCNSTYLFTYSLNKIVQRMGFQLIYKTKKKKINANSNSN